MRIKFVGAVGGEITGSCIMCCARSGTRFLVDCGIFQGSRYAGAKNARFPFDPKSIDFVLLTHAHADHCMRIPSLYMCGFAGKIYCSKATRELAILNILDGLKHEELPSGFENLQDKKEWEKLFVPLNDGQQFFADTDLQISMLRSSHFLGSTGFSVGWNLYKEGGNTGDHQSKTICFSGDLGGVIDGESNHLPLLKDGFVPWVSTDYIVMESTYGSLKRESSYKDFDSRIEHLNKLISADDLDTFVFSCFSMQRTQDILFDLLYLAMRNKEHCFEIKLDSDMGIKVCKIYKEILTETKPVNEKSNERKFIHLNKDFMSRFLPLLGEESEDCNKRIDATKKFISDVLSARFKHKNVVISFKKPNNNKGKQPDKEAGQQSKKKKIHITSSGMFQHGPILRHFEKRHDDERTAFFITGFCKSTDNGKTISSWLDNTDSKGGVINCNKIQIDRTKWKAKIHNIAPYYSGHADKEGLLRFLFYSAMYGKNKAKGINNKNVTVFLNHGNVIARAELKRTINEKGAKPENQDVRKIESVLLPNATDPFFDLDRGKWDTNSNSKDLLFPFFMVPKKSRTDSIRDEVKSGLLAYEKFKEEEAAEAAEKAESQEK